MAPWHVYHNILQLNFVGKPREDRAWKSSEFLLRDFYRVSKILISFIFFGNLFTPLLPLSGQPAVYMSLAGWADARLEPGTAD